MMNIRLIAVVSLSVLIGACSDETNEQVLASEQTNDFVMIRVDNKDLLRSTFDKWVGLKKKILSLSLPKGNKVDPQDMSAAEIWMLGGITNSFIREVVIANYAKENGIAAHTNYINFCRRGFIQACKLQTRNWNRTLKNFSEEEQVVINDRVYKEALDHSVKRVYVERNPIRLDESEVKEIKQKFLDYNHRCSASNDVIFATATNVWKQLTKGDDFAELASRYDQSEDRSENGEWGDFRIADFDSEPELRRICRSFRPGYLSAPIEGDNGLMIVKVLGVRENGVEIVDPDYVPSVDSEFRLSRIFFHLPQFIEMVDDATFARNVREAKANKAAEDFIKELMSRAKVEFPNGTGIFDVPAASSK